MSYVGRGPHGPGKWGNKYASKSSKVTGVIHVDTAKEAVRRHKEDILADLAAITRIRLELKDKVLGCWCALLIVMLIHTLK